MQNITLIDSHTGGEPTRTVVDVQPRLMGIKAIDRLHEMQTSADWIRRAILLEPRGNESMVGALLGPAPTPDYAASVVFFNNTGYLGMCGHGLIGVVETLRFQNRIAAGVHRFDTPAGDVVATLHPDHSVSFCNVPSYRFRKDVSVCVEVDGRSQFVTGDIAYGGNWFFLVAVESLAFEDIESLTDHCLAIRDGLRQQGITGDQGAEIDHIELNVHGLVNDEGTSLRGGRNFVLCPGGHHDRSPCGTGTSAKLACLAADEELAPDSSWVQESIIGSRFEAHYREFNENRVENPNAPMASEHSADSSPLIESQGGRPVIVTVKGRAHVTSQSTCVLDPTDPYCFGIVPPVSPTRSSLKEMKVTV